MITDPVTFNTPAALKEINRFVIPHKTGPVRMIVTQCDRGYFFVDRETTVSNATQRSLSVYTRVQQNLLYNELVGWLSNAMFNQCYIQASQEDKAWMMGET